jgi:NTP pyrophosphatase (non-canonical NTP hydrolase)
LNRPKNRKVSGMKPLSWWAVQKFGKLRIKTPDNISPDQNTKLEWICECGKSKWLRVQDVTGGKISSCGKCNEMSANWWEIHKFGKLVLKNPKPLDVESTSRTVWRCECGTERTCSIRDVVSGKIASCDSCEEKSAEWWSSQQFRKLRLKHPVAMHTGSRQKDIWVCECGNETVCPVVDVVSGARKSCGNCIRGKSPTTVSRPISDIFDIIRSAGFSAELQFELHGYQYDILIRDSRTLINFGTKHSTDSQAEVYGYKLIRVNEKEWRSDRKAVSQTILDVLESRKSKDHGHRMKNELLAKIEELDFISSLAGVSPAVLEQVAQRKLRHIAEMKSAYEDIMSAAISSHHVMCEVKKMKPNEAFGNNPFVYYGLGLAGEAGELTGALLRAMRNGGSFEDMKTAAESELADCLIYAVILAYSTGIDLIKLVNEKARVVELRAKSGYYGGSVKV